MGRTTVTGTIDVLVSMSAQTWSGFIRGTMYTHYTP